MTTAICYQVLVYDYIFVPFTKLLTPYFLPVQYVGKALAAECCKKLIFEHVNLNTYDLLLLNKRISLL